MAALLFLVTDADGNVRQVTVDGNQVTTTEPDGTVTETTLPAAADGSVNFTLPINPGETVTLLNPENAAADFSPAQLGNDVVLDLGAGVSVTLGGFYGAAGTSPPAFVFQSTGGLKVLTPEVSVLQGSYTVPPTDAQFLPENFVFGESQAPAIDGPGDTVIQSPLLALLLPPDEDDEGNQGPAPGLDDPLIPLVDGDATGGGGAGLVEATNDAPSIDALGLAPLAFAEGGAGVVLDDGDADLVDAELDGLNNYAQSTLTIARAGGANVDDAFGFQAGNGLSLVAGDLHKGGVSIASFTNVGGMLTVAFTDVNGGAPTSADADNVLRQVTYSNASVVPPANVVLSVTFNDGGVGGGAPRSATSLVTVNITSANSAPQVLALGPTPAPYDEAAGIPVAFDDGDANLVDAELDALDNYASATLTASRQGGANAEDVFSFQDGNGLSLVGGNLQKGGASIAAFTSVGGTLTVTFTDANGQTPTSVDADNVLRQLRYANTNGFPPANVTIDVTLDDGNIGGGGAQQAAASATVNITPGNGAPQVLNLGPAPAAFVEGGPGVVLDGGDAELADPELDALDNYTTATLTMVRQGGANGDDAFGFQAGNGLSLVGGDLLKGGNSVATFVSAGGTLTVTFTDANGSTPTSTDADNVLRQVTYSNPSVLPPASVTLDVTLNDGGVGGGAPRVATSSVTLGITPVNSTPQVLGLGPAPAAFVEGGAAVLLDDNDADLTDVELDLLNDYDQAVLSITRQGGADGDDSFGFQAGNGLSLAGGNLLKAGNAIATFVNAGGTLTVTFTNANGSTPTSTDADNVLRQVTYSNGSAVPPANVTLDVTLNDGNVGGGGAQSATASVTVTITPVNSAPVIQNLGPAPTNYVEAGPGVVIDDGDGRARCPRRLQHRSADPRASGRCERR